MDVLQLHLSQNDENVRLNFIFAELCSVCDPLTRWVWKDVLKQELLRIQVSTFFGVNNLQKT